MESKKILETPKYKYLKILLTILAATTVMAGGALVYLFYYYEGEFQPSFIKTFKNQAAEEGAEEEIANCPWEFTEEERLLMEDWQTFTNNTYHFSFKLPRQWEAAISNNDNMASFAEFPFGDESLAAINLISVVGDETENYPVGDLTEKERKSFTVGCQEATYIEYEETENVHWEMNEHHFRTSFTKEETPYLMILNFPVQGASADGDTIEAYNLVLKTFEFEE